MQTLEKRVRIHGGQELQYIPCSMILTPEAEGEELEEEDDDDDELKMMTHAFTKCQDKCAFAGRPPASSGKFSRSDWPCELCSGGEGGGMVDEWRIEMKGPDCRYARMGLLPCRD